MNAICIYNKITVFDLISTLRKCVALRRIDNHTVCSPKLNIIDVLLYSIKVWFDCYSWKKFKVANKQLQCPKCLSMSFKNILKSNGPKWDAWGTPDTAAVKLDTYLPILTIWCFSVGGTSLSSPEEVR